MKKLISFVLVLFVVALLFAGCTASSTPSASASASVSASTAASTAAASASASTAAVDVKIGYSCPNMNNTFQTYLVNAAKDKAAALGVTITVSDAQNDVVKQQDQVKTFIQQGVSALVVCPVDTSAMQPVTEAAAAAKIPLVYVNASPFKTGDKLPENAYYVGSDESIPGKIQGEFLGKALGGKGGVCIVQGGLAYEATFQRTQGVEDALKKDFPDMKVLAKQPAEWQRDKAVDVVNGWLAAYGKEISAICANNDEMALGAVEALKAAGRTDVLVCGVDAIPDGVNAILSGEMACTVFQDAVGQGGGAVALAVNIVNGQKPAEAITWIPFIQVDKTNASQYVPSASPSK